MKASFKEVLRRLPFDSTGKWPQGVWDAEALSSGSMTVTVFAPEGTDEQTAHEQDELYFVMNGSAVLMLDTGPVPARTGDVLFVPAGAAHHFEHISDEFATWVVFWGPRHGEAAVLTRGAKETVPG